tara:strand:- start:283 stop:1032 length:750 start_codon:yes stop_codon:yes gene_type:complete
LALPPEQNPTFIREVDEELRREELLRIWRSYGVWIVVAVVAILLGVAIWLYMDHRSTSAAAARGERYDAVVHDLSSGQKAKAAPELAELSKTGGAGYGTLARLEQANILLEKGDLKGAAAKFAEIESDPAVAEPFRQLATIRRTYAEFDSMKPSQVIDRLKALAVPDSPWFGSAGELVAMAYMKQGKRSEAGALLSKIAQADNVPDSLRQRVLQLAGVLGADASATAATSEATAAEPAANEQSEGNTTR